MLLGGLLLALLASICLGWGALAWRLFTRCVAQPFARPLVGEVGLIGVLTVGALATTAHFLIPVASSVAVGVALVGVAAAGWWARSRALSIPRGRTVALVALLAGVLAASAHASPIGYDAGLYHLPVQQWIREEPIVIGFANLHHRFGFNSMHEVLSSLLWLRPGDLRLLAVGEQLYVFFVLLTVLETTLSTRDRSVAPAAVGLLGLVSFAAFNDYYAIAITFNDNAVGFLFLAIAIAAFRAGDVSRSDAERRSATMAAALLAALAVALKASAATLVVIVLALVIMGARRQLLTLRSLRRMIGFGGLLLLPTVVRGYVLSGCLAFPSESTCVGNVSFGARSGAAEVTDLIKGWARAPHTPVRFREAVLSGDEPWVAIWWERTDREIVWLLCLLVGLSLITWFAAPYLGLRTQPSTEADLVSAAIVATEFVALAFWWWQAPDTRFGIGPLHLATVLPAAVALRHHRFRDGAASRALGAIAVPLTLLAAFSISGLEATGRSAIDHPVTVPAMEVPEDVVVVPNPAGGVRPQEPDQCWLAPKPCVPYETEFELGSWGPYTMVRPPSSP